MAAWPHPIGGQPRSRVRLNRRLRNRSTRRAGGRRIRGTLAAVPSTGNPAIRSFPPARRWGQRVALPIDHEATLVIQHQEILFLGAQPIQPIDDGRRRQLSHVVQRATVRIGFGVRAAGGQGPELFAQPVHIVPTVGPFKWRGFHAWKSIAEKLRRTAQASFGPEKSWADFVHAFFVFPSRIRRGNRRRARPTAPESRTMTSPTGRPCRSERAA